MEIKSCGRNVSPEPRHGLGVEVTPPKQRQPQQVFRYVGHEVTPSNQRRPESAKECGSSEAKLEERKENQALDAVSSTRLEDGEEFQYSPGTFSCVKTTRDGRVLRAPDPCPAVAQQLALRLKTFSTQYRILRLHLTPCAVLEEKCVRDAVAKMGCLSLVTLPWEGWSGNTERRSIVKVLRHGVQYEYLDRVGNVISSSSSQDTHQRTPKRSGSNSLSKASPPKSQRRAPRGEKPVTNTLLGYCDIAECKMRAAIRKPLGPVATDETDCNTGRTAQAVDSSLEEDRITVNEERLTALTLQVAKVFQEHRVAKMDIHDLMAHVNSRLRSDELSFDIAEFFPGLRIIQEGNKVFLDGTIVYLVNNSF